MLPYGLAVTAVVVATRAAASAPSGRAVVVLVTVVLGAALARLGVLSADFTGVNRGLEQAVANRTCAPR